VLALAIPTLFMKTTALKSSDFGERKKAAGITLVEVLVVMTVIAVLASILLPTLARSKVRAQTVFCLNNTKQLTLAWIMYADDHSGVLAYNLGAAGGAVIGLGGGPLMNVNWANNVLDWQLHPDNTNTATLTANGLGPYTSQAAAIYRCPSDYVLSDIQKKAGWKSRVRSYSMNAMVGDAGRFSRGGTNMNNPDYRQFFKYSAIPHPTDIFVFLDEHPDSIRDGYFINRANYPEWRRLPASYHGRAACFSFADGHSETHRWVYPHTTPPSLPDQAHLPRYIPANETGDFEWIISRMSVEREVEASAD
jgi:type II secretory pathway pseudopilin PulG